MPSRCLALSLRFKNKGKKRAVIRRIANSQRRVQSSEENRNNVIIESAIDDKKENGVRKLSFGKDAEEQFDLAMEDFIEKLSELEKGGKEISVTPKSTKNVYSPEPSTPSRHQKAHIFVPKLNFKPLILRTNLKKPVVESLSSFGNLFLTRKSVRTNPTDNKILLQILEKVKALTRVTIEQSEQIKQSEKKIKKLTNTIQKLFNKTTISSSGTIVS